MPSLPYHVYLDLDVINNDYSSNSPPQLRFEESRNAPFLDGDSKDYFCSIARFSIQTANTLPVFIPKIDSTAVDINTTIYKITFVYTKSGTNAATYTETANIMFKPSVPYTSGPLPYNYYYIYNYVDFINMINTCFDKLMNTGNIGSQISTYYLNTFAPFIEIDSNTLKCSITGDKQFFVNRYNGKDFLDNPNISIYFNKSLYALFPTLPYKFNSSTGDLNYKLIFEDLYGVNSIQVNTNTIATLNDPVVTYINRPGIQITQEISSVSLWNPVSSIVFTTSLLPIVPTQTSKPIVYNSSSSNFRISGEPNISSILSDFEVSLSPDNQYRPDITYVPPGEFRLVDMYSSYNLNKVDLLVYWKDNFGNLNPLYLQPGCGAHVKLLFRRKHFYIIHP